jgi:hypothetical protein
MDAESARRFLTRALLLAVGLSGALGCFLYALRVAGAGAGEAATVPYENYLLYVQHYDWVAAPYLQAFRAASICAVCLGPVQLAPRMAKRPGVWIPVVVLAFAIQVTVFNVVVDYMAGTPFLFDVYLVMSWFEPWLMLTLGTVSDGVFGTGGLAFVALATSCAAFFLVRRGRGLFVAAAETVIFLSVCLLLFELGIAEFMPFWWERQVTGFQFTLGVPWLTNSDLFSAAGLSAALSAASRVAYRRLRARRPPTIPEERTR